jgi:hypothetical protein
MLPMIAALLGPGGAHAEDGAWEVRLRAVYLNPQNGSDAVASPAIPNDAIHINGRWFPDLDIEHFLTPHLSSELLLTILQLQRVTVEKSALGGSISIGTFKHLPPICRRSGIPTRIRFSTLRRIWSERIAHLGRESERADCRLLGPQSLELRTPARWQRRRLAGAPPGRPDEKLETD